MDHPLGRLEADAQMRRWMLYHYPNPHLYGLSVLGTSLRVYCGDKAAKLTLDSVGRPNPSHILPKKKLQGLWI